MPLEPKSGHFVEQQGMNELAMKNWNQGQEQFNLYTFQKRTLPVLLGWAAGSMVAGGFWVGSNHRWLQGVGSQFLGWGLIDGLIALFGWRAANNNAAKNDQGETSSTDMQTETQNFERILWVNTGLDVGYLLFGSWITDRASEDERRRGIGWGIIFQGAFLLIWDLLLLSFIKSNRHDC
jgi:hypothetical protein